MSQERKYCGYTDFLYPQTLKIIFYNHNYLFTNFYFLLIIHVSCSLLFYVNLTKTRHLGIGNFNSESAPIKLPEASL